MISQKQQPQTVQIPCLLSFTQGKKVIPLIQKKKAPNTRRGGGTLVPDPAEEDMGAVHDVVLGAALLLVLPSGGKGGVCAGPNRGTAAGGASQKKEESKAKKAQNDIKRQKLKQKRKKIGTICIIFININILLYFGWARWWGTKCQNDFRALRPLPRECFESLAIPKN